MAEASKDPKEVPCIYHAQGKCWYGNTCRFSHQGTAAHTTTSGIAQPDPNDLHAPFIATLRANTPPFVPLAAMISESSDTSLRSAEPGVVLVPAVMFEDSSNVLARQVESFMDSTDFQITRDYKGVIVRFRAGPTVSSVEIRSTLSTDQVENMSKNTNSRSEEFGTPITLVKGKCKTFSTLPIPTCCVCTEATSYPLNTSCGHVYCQECFHHRCDSFRKTPTRNGIVCCGTNPGDLTCRHKFALSEISSMTPSNIFESLLYSALAAHVSVNPRELAFCPIPDCTQVYRPTSTGDIITCATCLISICTTCQSPTHGGLTCEAFTKLDSTGRLAAQMCNEENGGKDCPKCGTWIEKIDGCAHVQCTLCETHFCFICLETFTATGVGMGLVTAGDACFRHVEAAHGSDGDGLDLEPYDDLDAFLSDVDDIADGDVENRREFLRLNPVTVNEDAGEADGGEVTPGGGAEQAVDEVVEGPVQGPHN